MKMITGKAPDHSDILYTLIEAQDYILAAIDKANQILDERFLTLPPAEFFANYRTLLAGKAIIDAVHFPAILDMGLGFYGTAYAASAGDILRATTDPKFNFTLPYFQKRVLPEIEKDRPEIVGISVTHTSELIPAFTLARVIKNSNPATHICLGGSTVTEVSHRIAKNPALWETFDSLITGPGEAAFSELIDTLTSRRDLSSVPNLIYKTANGIKKSAKQQDFDLNDACTPEYVSVPPGDPDPA